jgi:CRISPR/Cas system-associated exonuclease Cas4 (RecB family)
MMPHQPIPVAGRTKLEHGAYINASEIADFIYCERSWWLEKNNYFGLPKRDEAAAALAMRVAGSQYHEGYTNAVQKVKSRQTTARMLITIACLLVLVILLLFILLSQSHASAPKSRIRHGARNAETPSAAGKPAGLVRDSPQNERYAVVTILVLIAGGFALALIFIRMSAKRSQRQWRMPSGNLIYVDAPGSDVLVCHELRLAGRPDAIWFDGISYVPEERKTGIIADSRDPFDGHAVQLAAYCHLVTKHYGPVTRGLVSYKNLQHQVPYSPRQHQRLLSMLNRMQALANAADVNRSHKSKAKCRQCIAASMCNQSLA